MNELVRETQSPFEPLAIVGMACRLPGADNLDSLWELMVEGKSGIREMPPDRLDRRLFYSSTEGEQSKTYSSISGMIPARSGDPSSELRTVDYDKLRWDPCHEILCGVVEEARTHAEWSTEKLSQPRTGVYIGHSSGSALGGELVLGSMIPEVADKLSEISDLQSLGPSDRSEILAHFVERVQRHRPTRRGNHPLWEANYAAKLVADRFGFEGPQLVVDAACASSLYSLALAAAALAQGEIEQAVVASASYSKADSLILFSQARSCSANGSRPFDADADGLVSAEGYVVVFIKTLARARADGDSVHGIIRGIGISSDGRGRSLWAPRKEGQLEAIRRAYTGDVTKESVQYVEAHATSTQVGDATEIEALNAFFGDAGHNRRISLGSIKSNIGHTLESAGLAGLIKSVLCMRKGVIAPTINLSKPNPTIDWSKNRFAPVTDMIPWPDLDDHPRRSAINAFGIGGLNAHVIVDGPNHVDGSIASVIPEQSRAPKNRKAAHDDSRSIAIIGRGVVVPGAFDLNSFRRLLKSGESQLGPAPAERWRDTPFFKTRPAIRRAFEHALGGYIRGYSYDWRKHHIPPLQIEHANPLQFMLLDAAQQALDESGYGNRPFNRDRAAVVVGTLFGGEFSHVLQVGLRLPEILDELETVLRERQWSDERIRKLCAAAERQILSAYPAIKDQTGSFTCSTQASRIAKTLNVMGGALAIDSGDCSSLAALQSAQQLLISGETEFVFCAAAQRDLDAPGREAWNLRSFESTGVVADGAARPSPGEGAVVLLLRRLADARKDGDRVLGIIRDVRAMGYRGPLAFSPEHRSTADLDQRASDIRVRSPESSALTGQFGHLAGASGLFEIVGATVANELESAEAGEFVVRSITETCEYHAVCEYAHADANLPKTSILSSQSVEQNPLNDWRDRTEFDRSKLRVAGKSQASDPGNPVFSKSATPAVVRETQRRFSASNESRVSPQPVAVEAFPMISDQSHVAQFESKKPAATQIVRIWGVDEFDLRQKISTILAAPDLDEHLGAQFPDRAPYRLSLVTSFNDLKPKLNLIASAFEQGNSLGRMQDQGVYYCDPHDGAKPRIAVMFPGQGSQRTGMLSELIAGSAAARRILDRFDQSLVRFGAPRCSGWLTGEDPLPENDLQATQIAMLAADVCAFEVAREWGLQPDFLIGHSFGEYAAFVAAGSLELESAIAITLARSKAVAACAGGAGAMLSIGAPVTEVRPLVSSRIDAFVSHMNAPRQTVVAGTVQNVAELAIVLKDRGIPAIQIPVSSPFHTPLLQPAQAALNIALCQHRWRPPVIPLLSTVSGRFVADRTEMIDCLTRQLSEPLDWISHIRRLLAEDVRVFVEVGPGRVLTKLTQQIVGERNAFVLSIDDSTLSIVERRQRIQAAIESIGHPLASSTASDGYFVADSVVSTASNRQSTLAAHPSAIEPPIQNQPATVPVEEDSPETVAIAGEDPLLDFLMDVIVEQTGYPRDIIEMHWDLEADLGIDSIRKAQIMGELREFFEMSWLTEGERFHELRTVDDILELLRKSSGKGEWLHSAETNAVPATSPVDTDENRVQSHSSDTAPSAQSIGQAVSTKSNDDSRTSSEQFLIDFVIERTGYPRDVIDLDADLEADLGIDSIAKAQLIGEARDQFHLPVADASNRAALADLRTLRQISDMIASALPPSEASVESKSKEMNDSVNGHTDHHDPKLNSALRTNGSQTFKSHSNGVTISIPENPSFERTEASIAFDRGQNWGMAHRKSLQHELFDFADRMGTSTKIASAFAATTEWNTLSRVEESELRGIADGANVHPDNLLSIRSRLKTGPIKFNGDATNAEGGLNGSHVDSASDDPLNASIEPATSVTHRFRLEMSAPENRIWSGRVPDFAGGAIVIGNNPESDALVKRLEAFGVKVNLIRRLGGREEAVKALEAIWTSQPSPHLFVLSPRDPDAVATLEEVEWKRRRETGVTSLFWFCQKWLALVEQAQMLEDASLFGVTALGGDFGIVNGIVSPESGAITGLFKSIIIENWMNGNRTTPIKLVDLPMPCSAASLVDAICVELCERSYDVEIGWNSQFRSVLRSAPAPLAINAPRQLTPDGHWIITGGARGITAHLVAQLANRFPNIHFHLVGTAPKPALSEEQRRLAKSDLGALRNEVMRRARHANQAPLQAWQDMEKAIEIDRTLSEFKAAGIAATYHSCDVSNRSQLSDVLQHIRRDFGPIRGIVHGAGVGKDAGFQRKEAKMVERCLGAKLDGALNLMALTADDPLQAFIAFGSISGRFGANGHTDYSLANDMLAKLIRWQRQLRPSVPATVFHWHAWDDIGMATKAETRLALKMIGMQLMPATEGTAHFLHEIEAGLPLSEVLITDTRYYRMFFPADRIVADSVKNGGPSPMETHSHLIQATKINETGVSVSEANLDPTIDPFLTEHRLNDRPLVPMVIMAELLAEGASIANEDRRPVAIRDLQISASIKFPTDCACKVQVHSSKAGQDCVASELRADFRSRDGKLIDPNRLYAKAIIEFASAIRPIPNENVDFTTLKLLEWRLAEYPPEGAPFFVGGSLHCLRKYAIDQANRTIWGRISAPSLFELAGAHRDVSRWLTPSAVLDATLYTSGILAWNCLRPGVCLPQGFKRATFVRLPRPAEILWVRSQVNRVDESRVSFDITVWDSDEHPLLAVEQYVAAWLSS